MRPFFKVAVSAIIVVGALSCGPNAAEEKEVELKERELTLTEKEFERKQKNTVSQNDTDSVVSQAQKFEVEIGKTVNGFHYDEKGHLTYNGIGFKPAIAANTVNVPKFKISMLLPQKLAGAIALDVDGQNFLFFLDLEHNTATAMQPTNSWNAAQEIYWSPTKDYMVVHCAYEGEYFISLNTKTKKIVKMESLQPGNNYETMWTVESEPKWIDNKDVLAFKVAEYCNPYVVDCGENGEKIIKNYNVRLNAATLKIIQE